ncbi:MAG: geranylgeranylglyceryl/heptaprenylglyceryl phosphate synthase [Bacteroidota bacterium]|jgi:putative glycerol-1-phosphate prenyltransferase|nr:geranylgeranylglyceryl/heptaprenylglyceryl phosphate synthase [Bacteroidota bacterium]
MMPEPTVYDRLCHAHREGRAQLFLLVDPDKANISMLPGFVAEAQEAGVDGFLIGGSLTLLPRFEECLRAMKVAARVPVIIFPGGIHQISGEADAILFLSTISGRNPEQLIGQHVLAAPMIHELGIEPIATGYMIIESDAVTSTEFMSYSKPIPRAKPEIAAAHALAAEMLGMKLVYLEAGSGAPQSVPAGMIRMVRSLVDIPLFVGGGIRTPGAAAEKVAAGASVVIVGNHFEDDGNHAELRAFADAVHGGAARGITAL